MRTRHCEQGILENRNVTGQREDNFSGVMICESGDLPVVYMEENSGPRVIGCTKMEYNTKAILYPFTDDFVGGYFLC